jgi:hippurate hydrolase
MRVDDLEDVIGWRHHLHRNPELAFEERETAAFIAQRLGEWGLSVKTGIAGTGVVGTLTRGTSSRAIGIRADIDALPIEETSGVPHRSLRPGKMHACGHDGHIVMLLAAARRCAQSVDFDGTVHFVFQPAEESEGGGREMVKAGLFRDFPMTRIYGLHNWPALPIGECVVRDDAMMAAFGTFEIEVRGRGSHGAMPHEGADPVVAASNIVGALQTIASRNVSPIEASVVSVTQIHTGDTWNVIPEVATIRGTTRWFEAAVGDLIETRMARVAASVAAAYECTAVTRYERRYPATINDRGAAEIVRATIADMPAITTRDAKPSMAAEDFAFMLEKVPGAYIWLGARKAGANPGLHSPHFDFNDAAIPYGVELWSALVAKELRRA